MKASGKYMSKTLLDALRCPLLSLVMVACATPLPPSNDALYGVYERYIAEAGYRGIVFRHPSHVALVFGHNLSSLGSGIVGTCQAETRLITIDEEYWNQANDAEREVVVFHEAGHCLEGLPHDNSHLNIMNAYLLDWEYYTAHRVEMLDELFAKCVDQT